MIQLTLEEAKKLSILDIDIAMVRNPLADTCNEQPCVIITMNGDYSLPEKHRYPDICGKNVLHINYLNPCRQQISTY